MSEESVIARSGDAGRGRPDVCPVNRYTRAKSGAGSMSRESLLVAWIVALRTA